jgi:hypothetical protein
MKDRSNSRVGAWCQQRLWKIAAMNQVLVPLVEFDVLWLASSKGNLFPVSWLQLRLKTDGCAELFSWSEQYNEA